MLTTPRPLVAGTFTWYYYRHLSNAFAEAAEEEEKAMLRPTSYASTRGSRLSYASAGGDDVEGTGSGDEIVDQDDSDYSQPIVMDFSEMESAMANLSVARGGSSSGQSRGVKFTRTGSSKDVLGSFVGSPGKKGFRVDSPDM